MFAYPVCYKMNAFPITDSPYYLFFVSTLFKARRTHSSQKMVHVTALLTSCDNPNKQVCKYEPKPDKNYRSLIWMKM